MLKDHYQLTTDNSYIPNTQDHRNRINSTVYSTPGRTILLVLYVTYKSTYSIYRPIHIAGLAQVIQTLKAQTTKARVALKSAKCFVVLFFHSFFHYYYESLNTYGDPGIKLRRLRRSEQSVTGTTTVPGCMLSML